MPTETNDDREDTNDGYVEDNNDGDSDNNNEVTGKRKRFKPKRYQGGYQDDDEAQQPTKKKQYKKKGSTTKQPGKKKQYPKKKCSYKNPETGEIKCVLHESATPFNPRWIDMEYWHKM